MTMTLAPELAPIHQLLADLHAAGWRHDLNEWVDSGRDADGAPWHEGWRMHRWTRGGDEITIPFTVDGGRLDGGLTFGPRDDDGLECRVFLGEEILHQISAAALRQIAVALGVLGAE